MGKCIMAVGNFFSRQLKSNLKIRLFLGVTLSILADRKGFVCSLISGCYDGELNSKISSLKKGLTKIK